MMANINKVIDGEILISIEKPGTSPDNLLELDDGVDRPQPYNVTDIEGIDAG